MSKKSPIQQRAEAVKQAHADLSKQRPGFRDEAPSRQFREAQRQVTKASNKWGGKW